MRWVEFIGVGVEQYVDGVRTQCPTLIGGAAHHMAFLHIEPDGDQRGIIWLMSVAYFIAQLLR